MQSTSSVYRFSGLIAVLGLLVLLVGLIVMILLPGIRFAAWGLLALGVLLLSTAFIIDFRRVSRALTGRRGRLGAGTTVMASIFIGIILVANAISIGNYHRFDVTGLAQFTLTSQTKDVLSKLETPVQTVCFFAPGDPIGSYIKTLLTEYQNYTDQMSIKEIDPDEHPDQARQYGVTIYPSVVFESKDRHRLVWPQEIVQIGTDQQGNPQIVGVEAEHAFTSAILEVTGTVQKKVYFLTGHGETSINADYSYAKEGLLDNLYKVAILDLVATPSIPDDCTALIIAGPRKSLTSSEVEIIKHYLENDGWLMILTNPESPPQINQLLSSWGVEIGDGTVIDPSSHVAPSKDIPLVTWQRNFLGLPEIYFPGSTAIIPQPGYTPAPLVTEAGMLQIVWTSVDSQNQMLSLLRSSQESWLERDFNPNEEPEFDEEIEREGPLNLGFLITTIPSDESEEGSPEEVEGLRLLVIGDSDFASNQHFFNGNNGELFLNAVSILTAGKELISIERKVLPFRRLVAGPEVANFIRISSMGLLPLLLLVVAGVVWWRRR